MPIKATETSFLATSPLVAWGEFVELTGIREDRIRELMELGWLQPGGHTHEAPLFRQIDVYKTRKVDRLCEDFELPSLAGAIIVDLLERIEDLENRLRELTR
ncbi:MAG: MerR family transcriptional regulator [Desulfovibrionaceae bacterium]|nr:MerR family transcriptional regulator [Desulfovibrionaceae bacterium]